VIPRRTAGLIALAALAAGVIAFFLYFWWPSPLLDGGRITSFSYGPRGTNLRELDVHTRTEEGALLDEIVGLANDAPLTSSRVEPQDGAPMVVLFRDDGLQFVLVVGDDTYVGISEGDGSYVGSLQSPDLAALVSELAMGSGDTAAAGG
jgi:hypothetical protein